MAFLIMLQPLQKMKKFILFHLLGGLEWPEVGLLDKYVEKADKPYNGEYILWE